MLSRRVALVALVVVLAALPWSTTRAQTVPACPRGGGILAPATLGAQVMREGAGIGAVTLGARATDVERAWGPPVDCLALHRGYTFNYELSDDGGRTSLLVAVVIYQDRVDQILATLLPHSGGRGPAMRTGRGIAIMDPAENVQRAYGPPTLEAQNAVGYRAEGVAFQISRGVVGSIMIFPPGSVPLGWRETQGG